MTVRHRLESEPWQRGKGAAPPALDGSMDAAWNGALPLTVKVVGGEEPARWNF